MAAAVASPVQPEAQVKAIEQLSAPAPPSNGTTAAASTASAEPEAKSIKKRKLENVSNGPVSADPSPADGPALANGTNEESKMKKKKRKETQLASGPVTAEPGELRRALMYLRRELQLLAGTLKYTMPTAKAAMGRFWAR